MSWHGHGHGKATGMGTGTAWVGSLAGGGDGHAEGLAQCLGTVAWEALRRSQTRVEGWPGGLARHGACRIGLWLGMRGGPDECGGRRGRRWSGSQMEWRAVVGRTEGVDSGDGDDGVRDGGHRSGSVVGRVAAVWSFSEVVADAWIGEEGDGDESGVGGGAATWVSGGMGAGDGEDDGGLRFGLAWRRGRGRRRWPEVAVHGGVVGLGLPEVEEREAG